MGLWEEATGGTLFLDEITETNPLFQVKLLRALQEGEIRRVGSNRNIKVDVRVIAASNRDIEKEVEKGNFRQDLMYRLNAVTIDLPPLRESERKIYPAGRAFCLQGQCVRGREFAKVSEPALEILQSYDWPGNIRELENAVLHAVSLSDDIIYPEHLPSRIRYSGAADRRFAPARSPGRRPGTPAEQETKWLTLAEMEQNYVKQVLAHTGGNKQAASRILNIDRKTLARIINRNNRKNE